MVDKKAGLMERFSGAVKGFLGAGIDVSHETSTTDSWMYRGYTFKPYNPSILISKKGGLKVYDEMLVDDQVKAVLGIKKHAVLASGWDIEGGEDEHREFIQDCLEKVEKGLYKAIWNILSALSYGFSATEMNFLMRDDGKIGLKSLKTRAPHTFELHTDDFGDLTKLVQITGHGDVPLDPKKFIVYSYGDEFGNPYGESDLRAAYRAFFIKDCVHKFWAIFLERFGQPLTIGYWKKDASDDDIENLQNIVDNVQSRSSMTLPETVRIELLEAVRAGTAGYEACIEKQNMMIARSVLCPDLLGFSEKDGGSYALGKKHFDVFLMVVSKLREEIENEVVNSRLIKTLVDLNFQNVEKYPRFKFKTLLEEDKQEIAKVWQQAVAYGVVVPDKKDDEWFRGLLGAPTRESEEPTIEAPPKPTAAPAEDKTTPEGTVPPEEKVAENKFAQRKKTPYEAKVAFAKIEKQLDDVGGSTVKELSDVVSKIHDSIVQQVASQKIIENNDAKAVRDLSVKYTGDIRLAMKDGLRKVVGMGFRDVRDEIGKGPKTFSGNLFAGASKSTMANVLAYMESKAFTIAGTEKAYIEKGVQTILYNGLKAGYSTKDVIYDLDKFFSQYYYDVDGEVSMPARLETIVRTNFSDAYNQGRLESMRDPILEGFVEAVQWSSVMDDRTCFPANTKIETSNGPKNIEDISLGDKVITHTGNYENVYGLYKRTYKGKFAKIKAGGREVICSAEHRFYVGDDKFIPASQLKVGDEVVCL